MEKLLKSDSIVNVSWSEDGFDAIFVVVATTNEMGPNRRHDAIDSVARLRRHLEAARAGALTATGLTFQLLTIHKEESVTFIVSKDMHQQLSIVVEPGSVLVERAEECAKLVVIGAR